MPCSAKSFKNVCTTDTVTIQYHIAYMNSQRISIKENLRKCEQMELIRESKHELHALLL